MAEHAMPADVREFLAAIREAIDIPHPATIGDTEVHARILADRVMHTVIALRDILDGTPGADITWTTAYLRDRLADTPATGYRTWGQA